MLERPLALLVAAAVAAAASACGALPRAGGEGRGPTSAPVSSGAPESGGPGEASEPGDEDDEAFDLSPANPSPTRRAESRRAVRRAILAVASEPRTTFRYSLIIAEDASASVTTTGVYTAAGWATRSVFPRELRGSDAETIAMRSTDEEEDEGSVMHARSTGETVWMQLEDWPAPMTGCWLEMGPRQVPLGFSALLPGEPGYVSVLASLRVRGSVPGDDSEVLADLDLGAALTLLPARALAGAGITRRGLAGVKVPVSLVVVDDELRSLSLRGEDVLVPLEGTGADLSGDAALALPLTRYEVEYGVPDDEVTEVGPVVEPRADRVVSAGEARDGCRG